MSTPISQREARRLINETEHSARLRHLVGCVIETLEAYDSDDGMNQLVLAGIVAELKAIEADYE